MRLRIVGRCTAGAMARRAGAALPIPLDTPCGEVQASIALPTVIAVRQAARAHAMRIPKGIYDMHAYSDMPLAQKGRAPNVILLEESHPWKHFFKKESKLYCVAKNDINRNQELADRLHKRLANRLAN